LFVYRRVSLPRDLPVVEPATSEPNWQRLTGMAFLTPSLSRSTRLDVVSAFAVAAGHS
jgi:hypothetical protein